MPKNVNRELRTGLRQFSGIMEKVDVVITEMIADATSGPLDSGNIGEQAATPPHEDQGSLKGYWRGKEGIERRYWQQNGHAVHENLESNGQNAHA